MQPLINVDGYFFPNSGKYYWRDIVTGERINPPVSPPNNVVIRELWAYQGENDDMVLIAKRFTAKEAIDWIGEHYN